MIYTPWDLDLTWGNLRRAKTKNTTVPYGISAVDNSYMMLRNPAYFLLSEDPGPIKERYHELRADRWSDEQISSMIDEFEKQLFDSGAYRRDIRRWAKSTQQDPEIKLNNFRFYVLERMKVMDRFVSENLKEN